MKRLPVRLRLTLAFAAVLAVVLVVAGLFLYSQQKARLNQSIDEDLHSRESATAALVDANGRLGLAGRRAVAAPGEGAVQVLAPSGRVLDGTPGLRRQSLLDSAELRAALTGRTHLERDVVAGIEGPARLLATSEPAGGRRVAVVAAKGVDDRDEALSSLTHLLWILGPVTLLLASLAGYWVIALALRPVEEARRRERRFVQDASHELRTPLTNQKVELETALAYASGEEELRTAIRSAIDEVDRLTRLAEDLLVIARADEQRLQLTLESLDAGELLRRVGDRFAARAAQQGRRLEVEDGAPVQLSGDRPHLEQALGGLVDNALRHGEGEIRLWSRASGRSAELHVSDSGPGFPPEFLPHAFERFHRADGAAAGGAGLGLAIAAAIATAHGGQADARNAPQGGADVWLSLARA